jgi:hypothetical protein
MGVKNLRKIEGAIVWHRNELKRITSQNVGKDCVKNSCSICPKCNQSTKSIDLGFHTVYYCTHCLDFYSFVLNYECCKNPKMIMVKTFCVYMSGGDYEVQTFQYSRKFDRGINV